MNRNYCFTLINGTRLDFKQVFDQYFNALVPFADRYLGEREESESLVQDAFLALWENRLEFPDELSVKAYLYSTVRNKALNVLKHKMVERKHGAFLTEFIEGLQRSDYSEEEMQQIEQIKKVLQELPIQCRVVFTMSCLEGKKYKDIANELGISVNTVKSHVMKAYKDIRARVGENTSPILFFPFSITVTFLFFISF